MRAVILAVGSELLGVDRLDTNSLRLTEVLRRHGVELLRKEALPDLEEIVERAVRRAVEDVPLVLITGGLGPTSDDLTREAVARALGRDLVHDPAVLARISRAFERMGMSMPESNRKQADVVEGAELLRNRRGTAPGQRISTAGATIFLFPGVPAELEGMIDSDLVPWLSSNAPPALATETLTLRVACVAESEVERRLLPAYEEFGRECLTILATVGDVRVRASATAEPEVLRAGLERMRVRLLELLGDEVYSERESDALESVVGRLLAERGETVSVAESCTGGLVAERLTRVAGSSAYVLGAVVAYANSAKSELLGVDPQWIDVHGAVSEPVARALAEGACRRFGSNWGIGITGVAGPGGGSAAKPVGTVELAIARDAAAVRAQHIRLPGDRERVRQGASQFALDLLRRSLIAAR